VFDDVTPILDALQGRFKLGIITNGNSDPERCGLEGIFQFVILAQDYGVEKPDLRIFEIAMQEAGVSSSHFLHVGDSLENDVLGANQAGMRSVWLNREGRSSDTGIKPDFEISALNELNAILADRDCR
jgi:putative hydrolase of the HAD superfamily